MCSVDKNYYNQFPPISWSITIQSKYLVISLHFLGKEINIIIFLNKYF